RALTGDNPRVVKRRNEAWPRGTAQAQRFYVRGIIVISVQQWLGTVLSYAGDFDERRRDRHDDGSIEIEPAAVVRDRHAVIAGASGDHTAAGLFTGQREQAIERAALFERSGDL